MVYKFSLLTITVVDATLDICTCCVEDQTAVRIKHTRTISD